MIQTGEAVASFAETLIGTPFRLHGRDPKTGIDCVGVVIMSLASGAGINIDPGSYDLRNLDISSGCLAADSANLIKVAKRTEPTEPGDIILVKSGPAAFHLLIASFADQFIHAHAGLRRVVSMPGPLRWPVIHIWRPLRTKSELVEET
ncbi:NlpC/P60 family protein [Altererythrobacter sp. ZODW24]|uniref:NlpC/P60 family protein n=1 Tax=Altererythrobacter sp. ZODW24 TaxID=2185142 RepID=UPI000DF7BE7B|nr:NlpC/P60 family protein [Altererythrobacter sp. ZODW24]